MLMQVFLLKLKKEASVSLDNKEGVDEISLDARFPVQVVLLRLKPLIRGRG